ncbi:MAG: hypothetical protein HYS12_11590, partial [Planctomycetes bacterium]|nr:hypothetical protein [Planctomycetota bacterium]
MGVQGDNARDESVSPLRRWAFWRRVVAELLRQGALFLVGFLLLTASPNRPGDGVPGPDQPPVSTRPELRQLRQAVDGGDAVAQLAFFRKLTLSDKDRAALSALIARFGDESFAVREQAARDVISWGPRAAALLRRASRSADPETATRARDCLRKVLEGAASAVLVEAVHRLEKRPPPETAAVLLA